MTQQPNSVDYFRLKPIRAARVSEVSETTAASPVPVAERINFHIGNPLQDPRLSSAFLRIALGLGVRDEALHDSEPDAILDHLGWEAAERPKLELLIRLIQRSAPYMPRGGYSVKAPGALVKSFTGWLEHQEEALRYDSGVQSGRREIILVSGGGEETLRDARGAEPPAVREHAVEHDALLVEGGEAAAERLGGGAGRGDGRHADGQAGQEDAEAGDSAAQLASGEAERQRDHGGDD